MQCGTGDSPEHRGEPHSALVAVEGLRLWRRGLCLIDDLHLRVAAGDPVAVMGASGAGKSSLLRVLAGLLAPTTGRVTVGGSRVTMVFQDPRLLPWRSALDNVALAIGTGSRAQRRERARHWLDRVGLGEAAELFPAAMSGGMRQRVGIARAMVDDPDVVLVDEPFSSLDAALAERLRSVLLGQLDDRVRTVIWVTHDPVEAAAVATRTLVLDGPPTGSWRIESREQAAAAGGVR